MKLVMWNLFFRLGSEFAAKGAQEKTMNNIIYIIGLIVVVVAILSFFGLR